MVLISVDTLRPDHLGSYGYRRETSPRLDQLASEGARFTQAIAPNVPTMPSHTTLYTGLDALVHTIAAHGGRNKLDRRFLLLPQILQRHGYVTAAVDNLVTLGRGKGSWFARGYDHYSGFTYQPTRSVKGRPQTEIITEQSIHLLKHIYNEPFFLFVHYWDPHTPYRPPPRFDRIFYEGDERDPVHTSMQPIFRLADEYYRAQMADMGMAGVTDLEFVIAQYDAEIRTVDEQIGRLVDTLQRLRVADRTLVAVVSDHGEAFGEGDLYFDHYSVFDAVVRIAMILRLPDHIPSGSQIDALVGSFDLVPTTLEMIDLEPPYGLPYELTGKSLWPLLNGHAKQHHESIMLTEASRQASYGVRTRDHKLIIPVTRSTPGIDVPDFYGRPRDPNLALFNLQNDPGERDNILSEHPTIAAKLQSILFSRLQAAARNGGEVDPVAAQISPRGFEEALKRYEERAGRNKAAQ